MGYAATDGTWQEGLAVVWLACQRPAKTATAARRAFESFFQVQEIRKYAAHSCDLPNREIEVRGNLRLVCATPMTLRIL
jgi:hypothetical protein